jgi:hypothetical protein
MNTPTLLPRLLRLSLCLIIMHSLSGCAAVALSLVGAGAGAGISHQVSGVASRTFSEPISKIKHASLLAARRMNFEYESTDATENGQLLKTRIAEMNVSIELEILSPSMTRVSVSARKNLLLLDAATAQEVVVQIERALASNERALAIEAEDARSKPASLSLDTPPRAQPKSRPKTKGQGSI